MKRPDTPPSNPTAPKRETDEAPRTRPTPAYRFTDWAMI